MIIQMEKIKKGRKKEKNRKESKLLNLEQWLI